MNKPHTDLSSIVAIEDASSVENVNILEDWPLLPLKLSPYAVLDIYTRKVSATWLNPATDINDICRG
ncbi:uncharacterized protein K441DRAFT_662542 [Cenococcum geophilum 1.58]|uniref:uncharacterized protein n=1 Tax=Cenococcum geophilum 1.58 TaxID=794803 RepID=UPI00358F73EB|nr:hypothetical protein K441DRAFT_662542 [Cenococcum geophilum 1.58]